MHNSPIPATCKDEKPCKDVHDTSNSMLVTKSTVADFHVEYVCKESGEYIARLACVSEDYEIKGSSSEFACMQNGTWTPKVPNNCTGMALHIILRITRGEVN